MEKEYKTEMFAWAFPEVELTLEQTIDNKHQDLSVPANQIPAESKQEEAKVSQEKAIAFDEVEKLKQEYNAKLTILSTILNKLKYPISIIDDELIEIMMDLVKKVTKKIIYKEIKQDEEVIVRMFKELTGMVDVKESAVNVYLSAADYNRLNMDEHHPNALAHIDESLAEGDMIVKSHFTEVRALMNERIEGLLRVQYD